MTVGQSGTALGALLNGIPMESAISGLVIVLVFGTMLLTERLWPLRRNLEPKLRRTVRNLATGGVSLALMSLLQPLILLPVLSYSAEHRIGLLHVVELPDTLMIVSGILLLDYTLWWWHWANHRIPFLWRFHLVHHADIDMDSSTALRFHFGELALSILYRAAQIMLIGVGTGTLWIWQTVLFASILFHHGNLRLPLALERILVRVIVTPRMHAIHHSDRKDETDSNWSSLLSIWDYVHRTIILDVPQRDVRIGVPAWRDPSSVTFLRINVMPFVSLPDSWRLHDGTISRRGHEGPATVLRD